MQNNIGKQIINATKWSSITEIVAKIISPLVNMVLARLLAPEQFGIVATITMITSFADVFTDAGFQKYIIQHEFESKDELDKSTCVAFWTNLFVSTCIYICIYVWRDHIAVWVGNPEIGNAISIASINIIISSFSSIQMARYRRDFNFRTLFYARMGSVLIPIIVTIPLAFVLKSYWAILIGTLASNVFTVGLLCLKSSWNPKMIYSLTLLKKMFSFSAWTLLESISIWLTSYIGVFIVGSYLSDYYLGLYKTSMSTINSYMAIITSSITPVLFSALSRVQNDEIEFKRLFYTFQRLTALIVFPMGAGIYIYRDLVTWILLGEQWMEASSFIGLWGLTSSLTIIFSNFSSEVYRSKGQPKVSLLTQLIHLCFLIPTLMISVQFGFEKLYIFRCVVRIQIIVFAMIFMRCIYKFKILEICKNVFPAFVATIIMGIVGINVTSYIANYVLQFVSVLICIAVYFISLFILFPHIRKEILSISYINNVWKKFVRKCNFLRI